MTDEHGQNEYVCFAEIHTREGAAYWRPWYQFAKSESEAAELAVSHIMHSGAAYGEKVHDLRVVRADAIQRFAPSGPRPYAVQHVDPTRLEVAR